MLDTGSHYFRHGTYEVTFNVTSSEPGNTVDVYDPLYVNEDNTTGKILASAEVPVDGENIHLAFTIEDYAESIQFRVNCQTPMTFESVYLLSQRGLYQDPYIYAGLVVLASALFFLYRRKHKVRPEPLALLVFAALWGFPARLLPLASLRPRYVFPLWTPVQPVGGAGPFASAHPVPRQHGPGASDTASP